MSQMKIHSKVIQELKPAGGKTGFMEEPDMVRDFSQVKKEELYKALDLIDDREWKPFMEWCGGRAAEFGVWADRLGISSYTRQIDNYQDKVLDTNSHTRNQIDVIFENVAETDCRYAEIFRGHAETVRGQIKRVQTMIQVMQSANRNGTEIKMIAYGIDPLAEVSYEEKLENGRRVLESYLRVKGITDTAEQQRICDLIMERQPNMLINLYVTDCYSSVDASRIYDLIIDYYNSSRYKDIDYIIGQISEEDVSTYEEMFSLNTYDLLARMIYQEMRNPASGGQSKVLWATINRYFSEKNFTYGRDRTLRIILKEGGYASIDKNHESNYNAYHPDYDSEGWENAKRLAAILYSQIGEANADDVDEEKIREEIGTYQDIYGNNIENTIGNCDSFRAGIGENIFYEY